MVNNVKLMATILEIIHEQQTDRYSNITECLLQKDVGGVNVEGVNLLI